MNNKQLNLDLFMIYHLNGNRSFTLKGLYSKTKSEEERKIIEDHTNYMLKLHNNNESKYFSKGLELLTLASSFSLIAETALFKESYSILQKYSIISQDTTPENFGIGLGIHFLANMALLRLNYLINHDPIKTKKYIDLENKDF